VGREWGEEGLNDKVGLLAIYFNMPGNLHQKPMPETGLEPVQN
jgi:hypothetical protein